MDKGDELPVKDDIEDDKDDDKDSKDLPGYGDEVLGYAAEDTLERPEPGPGPPCEVMEVVPRPDMEDMPMDMGDWEEAEYMDMETGIPKFGDNPGMELMPAL